MVNIKQLFSHRFTPVRSSDLPWLKYATLSFGIERGTAGQAQINADRFKYK
jgi:hypothetical protein